jgi:hypothetical protein
MKTIRASEISAYLFCHRAWWYQRTGHEPENKAELAGGTWLHAQHGRTVLVTGCLRGVAYLLLFTSLVLAAVYLTMKVL